MCRKKGKGMLQVNLEQQEFMNSKKVYDKHQMFYKALEIQIKKI